MKVYGIIIYKREGEIYYMKCILMNKNTEVLVAEYNDVLKVFTYMK